MRTAFLAACLIMCTNTYAQRPSKGEPLHEEFSRGRIIKVNWLSPFVGTFNVHYELRHDENSSSQFEAFYFGGQLFNEPTPIKGFGITYNYRYYLTEEFPEAWYVQPYIRHQQYWLNNQSFFSSAPVDERALVFGAGIVFGYQYVFKERIAFDLFGGPMYNKTFIGGSRTNADETGVFVNGGFVRIGTTVGFIF